MDMNDIELRWKRIKDYQGEFYRTVEDRAYTHDEIKRMVDIANIRDKAIILFMASTGIRVGAVGSLRMRDLTEIPEYNILKIVVYARFPKDRYFCLCTPEAKSALTNYISFRRDICGERITARSIANECYHSIIDLVTNAGIVSGALNYVEKRNQRLDNLQKAGDKINNVSQTLTEAAKEEAGETESAGVF